MSFFKKVKKQPQNGSDSRDLRFLNLTINIKEDEGQVMLAQRLCANFVGEKITLSQARTMAMVKTVAYKQCQDNGAKQEIVIPVSEKIKIFFKGLWIFIKETAIYEES